MAPENPIFPDFATSVSIWYEEKMPAIFLLTRRWLPILGILLASGCGYQFQNAQNPLVKLGIRKVYVKNFSNQTVRPGIEHFFTTAMTREIRKGGVFELASSEDEADAVLKGVITSVDALPSASALEIDASTPVNVAASFTGRVSCQIILQDKSKRVIFQDIFAGSKSHPASIVLVGRNRIDPVANSTAPLINESENRIAVRYLSEQMMFEAYQKIVDLF